MPLLGRLGRKSRSRKETLLANEGGARSDAASHKSLSTLEEGEAR